MYEGDLGLPGQQLSSQGVIRYPVQRTGGHVGPELDLCLVSGVPQHLVNGVDYLDPLHCAQVHCRVIVDLLGR